MNRQGSTLFSVCSFLVPALAIAQGLQLLRGLLASLSVYLGQVRDIDSATLAGIILLIFLTGFAAPLIRRALGPRRCVFVLAVALALLRLAQQLSPIPELRLGVEIAGVVSWQWLLLFIASGTAATSAKPRPRPPVIAILSGLTFDTAINGAFATLDPAFSHALGPQVLTIALTAVQLTMIVWLSQRSEPESPSTPPSIWTCAIGPALALELLLFQNIARQVVLTGWSLPATFAWLLIANLLAIWIAVFLSRRSPTGPRWAYVPAAAALLASVVQTDNAVWAAVVALAGPIAIAALLTGAMAPVRGRSGGWLAAATGMLAIPFVLFGWYAHYEIDVPLSQQVIVLVAAALVALAACIRPHRSPGTSSRGTNQAAPMGSAWRNAARLPAILSVLLLLPLYLFLVWRSPEPPPGNLDPVRVATYNIHQGFDLQGMPSLERIATTLETERPHVVALQEMPRGWVVNGSVDALSWLAQRLNMHAAWGPAADPFWGNAVLSRFPIVEVKNRPMPNNDDLNLHRAYLLVTVVLDGEPIQIVATHLHHVQSEAQHRIPQVRHLVNTVDWSRPTLLLGDLNAQPHHAEIQLLAEAGLSAGHPPTPTYRADRPRRQIDYIMVTSAFAVVDSYRVDTDASDHLPLLADIAFRGR